MSIRAKIKKYKRVPVPVTLDVDGEEWSFHVLPLTTNEMAEHDKLLKEEGASFPAIVISTVAYHLVDADGEREFADNEIDELRESIPFALVLEIYHCIVSDSLKTRAKVESAKGN